MAHYYCKQTQQRIVLHAFWASSCSWRVRAALHFKGIPHEERVVDIIGTQHQLSNQYRAVNPAQKVPALEIDGVTLVESMAILQYLEETRPLPSLWPSEPLQRARVREICETIVSGIQPLQNIGLKKYFSNADQYHTFTQTITERGLQTLEELLKNSSGEKYCVGDHLTIADLCFVPQIFNAVGRLKLDISKHPTVSKLYKSLLKEELFVSTHPIKFKPKEN